MPSRVLPAQDDFVLRALRDFRVTENGQNWIARLRGEGRYQSAAFPELAAERQVLVDLIPAAEWDRPNFIVRWVAALRLPYLLFSFLPLVLVAAHAYRQGLSPAPVHILFLFSSLLCIHLACNLWGDYEDHLRGVDSPEHSGGSGVIQRLWIPAVHIRNAAAALLTVGVLAGILLFARLPWELVGGHLLWLGLFGAFGAASYSGWPFHYKYLGLGEPIVFLLSGPVVTMGAALIYTGRPEGLLWYAFVSLPLSFLAILRLHGGNVQRAPFDAIAGVNTIARALGFTWAKRAYQFLLFAPFLSTGALWIAGYVGLASFLASVLTLRFAVSAIYPLSRTKGPMDPFFHDLRRKVVALHFFFGGLYALSFLLPKL